MFEHFNSNILNIVKLSIKMIHFPQTIINAFLVYPFDVTQKQLWYFIYTRHVNYLWKTHLTLSNCIGNYMVRNYYIYNSYIYNYVYNNCIITHVYIIHKNNISILFVHGTLNYCVLHTYFQIALETPWLSTLTGRYSSQKVSWKKLQRSLQCSARVETDGTFQFVHIYNRVFIFLISNFGNAGANTMAGAVDRNN